MNAAYEDITIVDLDLKKTTWSRVHSSMRTLFLKLSREPERDWVRFFNEERESRVVPTRHGFWIEDGYIVFDCLLKNVETLHLPDFRQSLEYANERTRASRMQRFDEIEHDRVEQNHERDLLATLRSRVRDESPLSHSTTSTTSPDTVADVIVEQPEVIAAPRIVSIVSSAKPTVIAETDTATSANAADDFEARREEWRSRFRAAMSAHNGSDRDKN